MQCKCGYETKDKEHFVTTSKGLLTWCNARFDVSKAPYKVWQKECEKCKRYVHIKVYDCNGELCTI